MDVNSRTCKIFLTDSRISEDGSLIICGQYSKDEDQINNLMADIKAEASTFKPVTNVKIGDHCLAMFADDGQWYRGQVISKAHCSYMVEFIDYGNVQTTKVEDLRLIPKHFQVLDRQAHVFKLDISGTPTNSAALWTPIIPAVIQDEYLYSEIEIEVFNNSTTALIAECGSVRKCLEKKILIAGEKHYPFNSLNIGSKFEAYVANSSANGHIQVQQRSTENDLNLLREEMAAYYTPISLPSLTLRPESISVGSLVCSKHSVDGGIYRGQVQIIDGDICIVHHIDYGDAEQKSITDLYKLPEKFCHLPYQALECELDGVTISTSVTSDKVCDSITSFVKGKIFSVVVKQCMFPHTLLVDMTDSTTGQSLSNFLTENGFASTKVSTEGVSLSSKKYQVGEKVNMVLSWLESDGSFYCYNSLSEDLLNEQLDSLYQECTSENISKLKDFTSGTICCACYSEDGNWYRARVIRRTAGAAVVRFIDYGNTHTCEISSLLVLGDQFRRMPIQGIHCLLSANLEGDSLLRTLSALKDQEVVVEFVNVDIEPYAVRLKHNGCIVGLTSSSPVLNRSSQSSLATVLPREANIYKHRTVSLGSTKDIVLSETKNLKSLWCVLSETQHDLQNLTEETNEIYNSVVEGTYDLNPVQSDYGGPCVTRDPKDGLWYRSKLISIIGPEECKVLYVDCGRTEIVLKNSVKIISEDLLKLPMFALRFTLSSMISVNGVTIPVDQWNTLVQQGKNKAFAAVFKDYDIEKDLYFAALHDVAGHFKAIATNCDVKVPPLLVAFDTELPIRITFIENPGCIWVQLLDYQADLIVLTGRLNAYYNSLPNHAMTLTDAYPGQICCMKSSKTKNWCRGEIAFMYDDIIEVKFFDFGYIESAHLSDAKILMPDFLPLPCQAICCCLQNLKPISQKWCNGSVRYLKGFVAITGISAKFVDSKSDVYSAEIYVCNNNEKILLSSKLVEERLAMWVDATAAIETPQSPQKNAPQSAQIFFGHPGVSLIGAQFPVVICDAGVPGDFFVLPANSDVKSTYEKLRKELASYAHLDAPIQRDMYVGMPCICVLGRDCFRAAVVSNSDPDKPVVFFVDYGEKKEVSINCLKAISPIHITLIPPVAIRCTLHGIVEPQNEYWSSKSFLLFSKFCKENTKDLKCTIHGCVTDGVSQFFMVKFQTPFQDITTDLVRYANCRTVSPTGNMSPPFSLLSYIYSNLGVGIGKEDQFYVTHVERPDLFYCQLVSKFNEIDDFMDKVQTYCSNAQKKPLIIKDLEFTPLCFVLHEDGKWYRAHYKSSSINSPRDTVVDVLFVDFGNTFSTPLSNIILCNHDSDLAAVPIFALACCLSEMVASNSELALCEDIFIRMKENIEHRQLSGIVTGSTNGRLHLDFFVKQQRLNETIISGNLSPIALPERKDKGIQDTSLKGKYKEIPSIESKTVHSVYISQVTDPEYFHIRLTGYDEQFEKCSSEVDGFYTAVRRHDYSVQCLENGNIVCAKHPSTLRWCRALVVDCISNQPDQVLVEFVDIGEQEVVSVEDSIKRLVPDMIHWPRMTIKCQLANVLPVDNSWDSDSIEFFTRTVQYINCRIRFNTYNVTDQSWSVDMKIKGKNVAHMLVENKFAKYLKVPLSQVSGNFETVKTKGINSWPRGTIRRVYISHVESVSQVYLQPVESETALSTLMDKLNDSSLAMKNVTIGQLRLGISYAAKFEDDGQYYRANILSLTDSSKPDLYHVLYTDYGNRAFVKLDDLRQLPKEFAILPEQAMKCHVQHPPDVKEDILVAKLEKLAADEYLTILAECTKLDSTNSVFQVNLSIVDSEQESRKFSDLFKNGKSQVTGTQFSDRRPTSQKYSKIDVQTGCNAKVYVAQIDNPQQIWIQLSSSAPDLDKIMGDIDVFCNSNPPILEKFEPGTPCLAKYSADDGWYRGMILDFDKTKKSAKIHFVDYGNTEIIRIDDLRIIDPQFMKLPVQAVLCRLRGIVGLGHWTTNDTEDFVDRVSDIQLTAMFYHPTCKVNGQNYISNVYEVDLVYPCGKSLNSEWNETLEDRTINITTNICTGAGDSKTSSAKTSSSLFDPEHHIVTDRGDHVIVENLIPQTASIDFNTSVDLRTPNMETELEGLVLEARAIENGYISHCDNPGHFYVQLARLASDLDLIHEKTAGISNKVSVNAAVGKYYVAKSPDDDEWYRAKCTDVSGDKYVVFFVDYGNSATVDFNDLKPMSEVLRCFPVQAIECKLFNIEPVRSSWGSVVDYFLDLTLDKDLKIEFIKQAAGGIWIVKLCMEGKDLSEKVLKENEGEVMAISDVGMTRSDKQNLHLEVGYTLCALATNCDASVNFDGFLLNSSMNEMLMEVDNFVKKIRKCGGEVSVKYEDLKLNTVCLYKTYAGSDWRCIKIMGFDNRGSAKVLDISSRCVIEVNGNENIFIEASPLIEQNVERLFIKCSLTDVIGEKSVNKVLGRVVALRLIDFDEVACRWKVKISFLEDIISECAVGKIDSLPETHVPSIFVTDEENRKPKSGPSFESNKSCEKGDVRSWISGHFQTLVNFFKVGEELLHDCPSMLAPLHVALFRSMWAIAMHLTDEEKTKFDLKSQKESPINERLKRFSGDLMETGENEVLPAKKLKLDMGKNKSESDCELFSVGDKFEAIISSILHPGEFYVRPFLVMSEPIVPEPSNNSSDIKRRLKKLVPDTYCIAKCSDSSCPVHHWVRAVIEDCDGQNISVKDIDTGIRFVSMAENVFPIGEKVKSWPSFCMQCSLTGIQPCTSGTNFGWSVHAIKELNSLLGSISMSDCIEVCVVSTDCDDESGRVKYNVDVFLNDRSVAETLITLQVADKVSTMSEIDKENLVSHAKISDDLDRGKTRMPFTNLMPKTTKRQPSAILITPNSSDAIGQSVPNFDLLAVPWKIIRSSIGRSSSESLSDSVFVSDVEDSFVGSAEHPPIVGPKSQLTSFKIYCSTVSSESSEEEDTTLAADSIENILDDADAVAGPAEVLPDIGTDISQGSVTSSLLDLLTPTTAASVERNADEIADKNLMEDHREKKLKEVAWQVVEEVFQTIEEEDEEFERKIIDECTIPDSLNEVTDNNENSSNLFTTKEKILIKNLNLNTASSSDDTGSSTIPDLLCEISVQKELTKMNAASKSPVENLLEAEEEEEIIQAMENLVLDEVVTVSAESRNLIANENELAVNDMTYENNQQNVQDVDESNEEQVVILAMEHLSLCEIPSPEELGGAESIQQDKLPIENEEYNLDDNNDMIKIIIDGCQVIEDNSHNDDGMTLDEITNPDEFVVQPIIKEPEGINIQEVETEDVAESTSAKEANSGDELCEIPHAEENKSDTFQQIEIQAPIKEDKFEIEETCYSVEDKLPANSVSGEKNDTIPLSEADAMIYNRSSIDSLVEIPNPTMSNSSSSYVSPFTDMMQDIKPRNNFMPETGSYVYSSPDKDDNQLDTEVMGQEKEIIMSNQQVEPNVEDDQNIEELEMKVLTDTKMVNQEQDQQLGADSIESGDVRGVNLVEVKEQKAIGDVDQCSFPHANQRFYICCLPKMQLEVGDSYSVTYMNSENPYKIKLQFHMGSDSEDWRNCLVKVNEAKNVNDLNKLDMWEPDMMCLVQCPTDGSWDRGRIVSKESNDKYIVELIDYSDKMNASKDQLREIPESLCLYPRQTAQCSLGGITMIEEQCIDGLWNPEINQYLYDQLFCNTLRAEVLQVSESATEEDYIIRLFVIDGSDSERDVAKSLIDAKLAEVSQKTDEKKTDDEWSTMTDSAWETLLNPDANSTDQLHSSNVDLSNLDDPYPDQEGTCNKSESSEEKAFGNISPTDGEEVHTVAHDLQTKVLAGALIIAQIEDANTLGSKSSSGKKRRKSKDLYIDLEKIPQILVEAYESTEID